MLVPLAGAVAALLSLSSPHPRLSDSLLPCPIPQVGSFLGSGGSSEGVYRLSKTGSVLKESRGTASTAALLRNECRVLKRLEVAGIENVERCQCECLTESGRLALVLGPLIEQPRGVDSDGLSLPVVRRLMRTVAQTLVLGRVASTDLQLLVTPTDFWLIDWDQAQSWDNDDDCPRALVQSFIQEALALTPDVNDAKRLLQVAFADLEGELSRQPNLRSAVQTLFE